VVWPPRWDAAGDHIGISDRFDLLDPVLGGERVPAREQAVKQRQHV
jgi:hypothetical protein